MSRRIERCRLLPCLMALGALACGDDGARAPAAAAGGGGTPRSLGSGSADDGGADPVRREDAGRPDGGAPDGGEVVVLSTECDLVDPALIGGDELINQVTAPATDFTVTRVEATWESGCTDPTIRITLSDGRCPDGNGHELVFFFEADAFSGLVTAGQNTIPAEPGDRGIRARYRRPAPLAPEGEWGTCAGAGGLIDFVDPPSSRRFAQLRASFQLDLTTCDEDTTGEQQLFGTLNATLQRGLSEICSSP